MLTPAEFCGFLPLMLKGFVWYHPEIALWPPFAPGRGGCLGEWGVGWRDPGLGSEACSWAKLPSEQSRAGLSGWVWVSLDLWFWSYMAFLIVYSSTLSNRTLATQTLIITTLSSCSSLNPSSWLMESWVSLSTIQKWTWEKLQSKRRPKLIHWWRIWLNLSGSNYRHLLKPWGRGLMNWWCLATRQKRSRSQERGSVFHQHEQTKLTKE